LPNCGAIRAKPQQDLLHAALYGTLMSMSSVLAWATVIGVVRDVKQGGVDQATGTELFISWIRFLESFLT
jgi:hypothetical protein